MTPFGYPQGMALTLPECGFKAPYGYEFKEWSVKIGDAEAVAKQPADTVSVTEDTTVTAVWQLIPVIKYFDENGDEQSTIDYKILKSDAETLTDGFWVVTADTAINLTRLVVPAYTAVLPESTEEGTVTSDREAVALRDDNKTVTLTVTPETDYLLNSISVTSNGEPVELTDHQDGTYSFTMPEQNVSVSADFHRTIHYLDKNGDKQSLTEYSVIDSETLTLTEGFWAVTGDTENNNRIEVSGNVHLVLCDNTTLNAPKGIHLTGDGNFLTVYAESTGANMGKLTIKVVDGCCAAIGGNGEKHTDDRGHIYYDSEACGDVTINGGRFDVKGGYYGAGIGGSVDAAFSAVTINGGDITAHGGDYAAGIGCGTDAYGGTITINDGNINATGGYCGAGIGGGNYSDCERVIINGGTVNASGGSSSAGIGSSSGSGCDVTVNGGKVTANGGNDSAGIGVGYDYNGNTPGTLTLSLSNADDFFKANAFKNNKDKYTVVKVAEGKSVCDGENTYSGTLTTEQLDAVSGKTLMLSDPMGIRLAGHSISLEGDIGVNFYMQLSDSIANSQTAYMLFTIPTGGNTETKKIMVKDVQPKNGYHIFDCNVAAKEMDSAIKAQVFDGNGSAGLVYTYSIRDYADYLLKHADENGTDEQKEYAKAKPLVEAMLRYGDYAANYFSDSDPLADLDADIPESSSSATGIGETLFDGATLSLKSQTTLSLYFRSSQALTLTCEGRETVTQSSGSEYVIRIRNISSAELNNDFTVNITAGEESGTVTYSPLTYCFKAQETSNNAKLVNTVKSLYLYWDEANKYFTPVGN